MMMSTGPSLHKVRAVPLDRATATRRHGRNRLTDFALGARLALRGGGESLARSALTAIGIGVAVACLLVASSLPHIAAMHTRRGNAQQIDDTGPNRLLAESLTLYFGGRQINGLVLQAIKPNASAPPGVAKLPGPGDVVVSPEIARMLRSRDGGELRQMLGGRVTGVIGKAGLTGPTQLLYYRGSDDLRARQVGDIGGVESSGAGFTFSRFGTEPVRSIGSTTNTIADAIFDLLEVMLAVGLLAPIGQFITTAGRFGSERRNERLAAIRLLGASRSTTARIAAGESLPGIIAGMLLGAVAFLTVRPLVGQVHLFDFSTFTSDVQPAPWAVLAIAVLVPVACLLTALAAMRKTMFDPLSETRRGQPKRRSLTWRLILLGLGFVLLVPPIVGLTSASHASGVLLVALGAILILVAVTTLLPVLIERLVERIVGRGSVRGGASWQLAISRLRFELGNSGRAIGTIALAVAGAIALQILFSSVDAVSHGSESGSSQAQAVGVNSFVVSSPLTIAEINRELAAVPALKYTRISATVEGDRNNQVVIAPCSTILRMKGISSCDPDSAYVSWSSGLRPGDRLSAGKQQVVIPTGAVRTKTVLDMTGAVNQEQPLENDGPDPEHAKLLLTPSAAAKLGLGSVIAQASFMLTSESRETLEALSATVAHFDPEAAIIGLITYDSNHKLTELNRLLLVGALIALLVISFSVLVATADQLRERRAAIAGLAALGTPRATLALSLIWQIAVQIVLGLALAIVIGIVLGVALVAITGEHVIVNFGAIAVLASLGLVLAVLIALASLPLLGRQMRPAAMRTE